MHTVGREETEKGLTPMDPTQTAVEAIDEAKPTKRPSRKQASKALRKLKGKLKEGLSMEKLQLKNIVGEHMGGEGKVRGIMVSDALTTMDACQQVMHELKDALKKENDFDKKTRGVRALGELVGKMSGLMDTAASLQKDINEEKAPAPKPKVAPPVIHFHDHKGPESKPDTGSSVVDVETVTTDDPPEPEDERTRVMTREAPPWESQKDEEF